ncbi:MAG: hypothetical protein KGJ32_05100 [Xanthomonadaceae bacterium]|nr:hypothetical protein [Xanthomonadaceae bacterium]
MIFTELIKIPAWKILCAMKFTVLSLCFLHCFAMEWQTSRIRKKKELAKTACKKPTPPGKKYQLASQWSPVSERLKKKTARMIFISIGSLILG